MDKLLGIILMLPAILASWSFINPNKRSFWELVGIGSMFALFFNLFALGVYFLTK